MEEKVDNADYQQEQKENYPLSRSSKENQS